MTRLFAIISIILLAGCGTLSDGDKAKGLKAAKCLSNCAIVCGGSAAAEMCACPIYSTEDLTAKGIKAAQCLAACAIQCGIQASASAE